MFIKEKKKNRKKKKNEKGVMEGEGKINECNVLKNMNKRRKLKMKKEKRSGFIEWMILTTFQLIWCYSILQG